MRETGTQERLLDAERLVLRCPRCLSGAVGHQGKTLVCAVCGLRSDPPRLASNKRLPFRYHRN